MANDPNRTDDVDESIRPNQGGQPGTGADPVRGSVGDEVRGIADEGDEGFEDTEDLEDEEESDDGSF
jgi:hypothetical protein